MLICNYLESIEDEIFVYEEELPYSVRAFVSAEQDGTYTVYVNRSLSEADKLRAVQHEKEHIKRGDLHSEESAIRKEQNI